MSITAFSYPCILWPITKYTFSVSMFWIKSFNTFNPSSDGIVSLPFVLKLPPAIITGTLSTGNVFIFSFNSFSVSTLFTILNSSSSVVSFVFFSSSASIASLIVLPAKNFSKSFCFSSKYLSL